MANNNENKKNKQSLNDMLMNILFNIVIPVMILKKVPEHWDNENAAVVALCVALSFPIGFFIFDYIKTKKSNFISILGFISVLLTGVIGIFQIPNEYLAIKEASVPFIIMIVCLVSLITPFPVVEKLVYNDAVFNKDLINNKLEENNNSDQMHKVMRNSTLIVAASFLLSTILNYTLAKKNRGERPYYPSRTANSGNRRPHFLELHIYRSSLYNRHGNSHILYSDKNLKIDRTKNRGDAQRRF